MSYTDPKDPIRRDTVDPLNRDPIKHETIVNNSSGVDRRAEGGMSWFIIAALVIAAGVLGYLYFGNNTDTASNGMAPAGTEAPADTGRASTPTSPAETDQAAPAAAPAAPADTGPADTAPATPPTTPGGTGQ